jgi:nucleoid-associated protein YgaU
MEPVVSIAPSARRIAALAAPLAALLALPAVVAEPLDRLRAGAARFDDQVTLVAAALLGAVLLWVLLVLTATALAAAPGALGALARAAVTRCTPAAGRRATALVLGVTVAAGPAAGASGSPAGPAAAHASLPRPAAMLGPSTDLAVAGPASTPAQDRVERSRSGADPAGEARLVVDRPAGWVPPAPPTPRRARAAAPPVRLVTAAPSAAEAVLDEVVVRRGDTLWGIAARHLGPGATDAEIAVEWPRWYAANRQLLGADPDLVLPGTVLHPPSHVRP